jgi:hypothetical protein
MQDGNGAPKLASIIFFAILLSVTSYAPTFYAGLVSEVDVSQSFISERWLGVSGTVEESEKPFESFKIGKLQIKSNQTGEVLSAKLTGIKGGGYYFMAAPNISEITPENLKEPDKNDLKANQLFSEKLYPAFYPDYSQRFDTPKQTFEKKENITLNSNKYESYLADIKGSADMYLLKYKKGSKELPVFISPIDGMSRGKTHENCYVKDCNYQFLLPKLKGETFSYSINLISKGKAVKGCGSSKGPTSMIVNPGSKDKCITVADDNTYIDFNNAVFEGSGNCAISLSAKNLTLKDFKVKEYKKAICSKKSKAKITSSQIKSADIGLEALKESSLTLKDLNISESSSGIVLQDSSKAMIENATLGGTSVYGEASSVSVESYSKPLPKPSGYTEIEPLNSKVEITSLENSSYFDNFGMSYPNVNKTGLLPNSTFKFEINGEDISSKALDVSLRKTGSSGRRAVVNKNITQFSIFSLYGVDVKGNRSSSGDENEGGGSETGGSTGSEGGGSASGGSGGGGGIATASQLAGGSRSGGSASGLGPEDLEINMTMEKQFYDEKRGETVSVEFTVKNTGNTEARNLTVAENSDWASIPKNFDNILPEERKSGIILTTVPEDASTGNQTHLLETKLGENVLDTANYKINVSAKLDNRRVNVIESPPFLTAERGSQKEVGIQVENPSPRPLRSVKATFRGDNCAIAGNRTFEVPAKSTETIQVKLKTVNKSTECSEALVLKHENEIVGFTPMRIEIKEKAAGAIVMPVYFIILFIWTTLLAYRLKTRNKTDFIWR